MYLHVRIQQARVSGRDSEPDRGGFFAQLAHSGYATGCVSASAIALFELPSYFAIAYACDEAQGLPDKAFDDSQLRKYNFILTSFRFRGKTIKCAESHPLHCT